MQPAAKPIGVMVVDDHQTMLWGLSKLIDGEKPRMQVVGTARNCEEALEQVGQLMPDVIVLDLDLDGKSALDILPGLLSNSASRALILTGERRAEDAGHGGAARRPRRPAQGCLGRAGAARRSRRVHRGELCMDAETMSRVFAEFMATRQSRPARSRSGEAGRADTPRSARSSSPIVEGSGASNKALANQLFITEHTLRNHLTSIYQKLGVANRLELYVYAVKHQLGKAAELSSELATRFLLARLRSSRDHRQDRADDLDRRRAQDDHEDGREDAQHQRDEHLGRHLGRQLSARTCRLWRRSSENTRSDSPMLVPKLVGLRQHGGEGAGSPPRRCAAPGCAATSRACRRRASPGWSSAVRRPAPCS